MKREKENKKPMSN